MVWFQCEVCGDNLKKPKLPGHFRVCSAHKLSCIDCGETFSQESVQGHTQCITETEKYGPKGQNKVSNGATPKAKSDSKQRPEVDIFVGLSERPPWFCSLCNTSATSKQTLLLHAEGKKHRAKARAYHASKQPPKENEEPVGNGEKTELLTNENPSKETTQLNNNIEEETVNTKKRKLDGAKEIYVSGESGNGEVIQVENVGKEEYKVKKSKKSVVNEDEDVNPESNEEGKKKKIKWKKLITLALKSEPDNGLKMRKLRKSVFKTIKELGFTEDESQLTEMLEKTVNSRSKFTIEGKYVRLVAKN